MFFGNHSNAQWSLSLFSQMRLKIMKFHETTARSWRSFVRPVCQVPQKRDRRSFYFAHGSLLSLFGCESQCHGVCVVCPHEVVVENPTRAPGLGTKGSIKVQKLGTRRINLWPFFSWACLSYIRQILSGLMKNLLLCAPAPGTVRSYLSTIPS